MCYVVLEYLRFLITVVAQGCVCLLIINVSGTLRIMAKYQRVKNTP